ncbi:hypothetical protein [Actinocrispum sp. NPDC049592]|uniref:hypothetical protein n=1 Tax=Actinocrispum sp. NPDC049592 TaxID=3154835 RepID=UPI003424AAA9
MTVGSAESGDETAALHVRSRVVLGVQSVPTIGEATPLVRGSAGSAIVVSLPDSTARPISTHADATRNPG